MKQTFLEHLQEAVGAKYSAEDIFANLDPDEIIQEAEKYALDMASVVGQSEQLKCPSCGSDDVMIDLDYSTCGQCKNLW